MNNKEIEKSELLDKLVLDKIITNVEKVSPQEGDMIVVKYDGDYYDLNDVSESLQAIMAEYTKKGVAFIVIDKHYELELRRGRKPKEGDAVIRDLLDVMKPVGHKTPETFGVDKILEIKC